MQILRHNLARFLIVALVGVWSHAAYQDCLAFMAPEATAGETASPPCHVRDSDSIKYHPVEQTVDHDCLGVCDCGLQAVPVSSQTLHLASEYKLSPDDNPVIAILDQKFTFHRTTFHFDYRHERPADSCLHPHQKYCIQLK